MARSIFKSNRLLASSSPATKYTSVQITREPSCIPGLVSAFCVRKTQTTWVQKSWYKYTY